MKSSLYILFLVLFHQLALAQTMKPKELKLAIERGYMHTSLRLALQEPDNV